MSRQPISRSEDLARLQAEGYTLDICGGKLVVRDVPYVDAECTVHRDGALVIPLTLAGDIANPPGEHTAHFSGGIPFAHDGSALTGMINGRDTQELGDGVIVHCSFSMMPNTNNGRYLNFYEKVTKYIAAIAGHATFLDPNATATVSRPIPPDEDDGSPFHYIDTASSRAGIDALNDVFRNEAVAIVGTGGTGGYLVDLVTKTCVASVDVFDADVFLTHNAFRAPGAPTLDQLNAAPLKVDHLAAIYSNMHRRVIAHPHAIDENNVAELAAATFVFLSIDDPEAKAPIVAFLVEQRIPFVDVGMGVELVSGRLTGTLRTTLVTPDKHDHVSATISLRGAGGPDAYRSNIQIAELNARNAADAVIAWKRYRGFYADLGVGPSSGFTIATNHVVNSGSSTAPTLDGEESQ